VLVITPAVGDTRRAAAPRRLNRGLGSRHPAPARKAGHICHCHPRPPRPRDNPSMPWYECVAAFFAGAFLANVVPHFVAGVSGRTFPTPFAHPPGKGHSSPTVNVLWSLVNLVAGYVLLRAGRVSPHNSTALLLCLAGIAALSLMLSRVFRNIPPQ